MLYGTRCSGRFHDFFARLVCDPGLPHPVHCAASSCRCCSALAARDASRWKSLISCSPSLMRRSASDSCSGDMWRLRCRDRFRICFALAASFSASAACTRSMSRTASSARVSLRLPPTLPLVAPYHTGFPRHIPPNTNGVARPNVSALRRSISTSASGSPRLHRQVSGWRSPSGRLRWCHSAQCLNMRAVNDQYRAAELQLMDAVRAGEVCDFADGGEITAEEMASWGPERTIRATLLRRLLTAEDAQYAKVGVRLRGAAVEGVLDLQGVNVMNLEQGVNVMNLELKRCRLTNG